jgi:hypothetical protein
MADYLSDSDVKQVLELARGTNGLAKFRDTLAAVATLVHAVEPLAAETQRLRALVGAQQQDLARAAQVLREKDTQIARLHGEVTGLEHRLAALAAA